MASISDDDLIDVLKRLEEASHAQDIAIWRLSMGLLGTLGQERWDEITRLAEGPTATAANVVALRADREERTRRVNQMAERLLRSGDWTFSAE